MLANENEGFNSKLQSFIGDVISDYSENSVQQNFVRRYDRLISRQIQNCVKNVIEKFCLDIDDKELQDLIENESDDLIDAITNANYEYFWHGMKTGARILLELIS